MAVAPLPHAFPSDALSCMFVLQTGQSVKEKQLALGKKLVLGRHMTSVSCLATRAVTRRSPNAIRTGCTSNGARLSASVPAAGLLHWVSYQLLGKLLSI